MKSGQKRKQLKNETPDKDTEATIRAIAHEHGMNYQDAVVQYRRMEIYF